MYLAGETSISGNRASAKNRPPLRNLEETTAPAYAASSLVHPKRMQAISWTLDYITGHYGMDDNRFSKYDLLMLISIAGKQGKTMLYMGPSKDETGEQCCSQG